MHARKAWLKGLSPKENREVPPLRHGLVHRLKRERPGLRILINGGLATLDAALTQLEHVDGVMLGRAAYHDPHLLHQLDAVLSGTPLRARGELLRAFLPWVEMQLEQGLALRHVTRHILGLFHGQPGGRAFRQILSEGSSRPGAGIELIERALRATQELPHAA